MKNKTHLKLATTCIMLSVLQVANISTAQAGNGFFSLFGSKKKQEQVQPIAPPVEQKEEVKTNQPPIKKATVQAPKIFTYVADKLVKIDFSKIEFKKSISLIEDAISYLLPFSYINTNDATIDLSETNNSEQPNNNFLSTNIMAEKDIAEALVEFYAKEGKPVWSNDFIINDKAKELINYMNTATNEGLNPEEYRVEIPDTTLSGEDRIQAFYNFDVALSARALRYIQDAGEGRVVANRLSEFHDLPRRKIDLNEAINKLSKSDNPQEVAASYLPNSVWYNQLKTALAQYKKLDSQNTIVIKSGTLIRPGQTNEELPKVLKLIQKHAPANYNEKYKEVFEKHAQATVYDPELVEAIKEYQKLQNKKTDGVIGPVMINALQEDSDILKYQRLKYSMDRLRWLPHDFTKRYVFINQPAYTVEYYNDGQLALEMKVVIGSKNNQTTFFYDNISMVQFNPSWGVPRSIVLNEMMPRIMSDPSYLNRNGYKVYNGKGKQVDPSQVDWAKVSSTGYGVNIRQQPGRGNALGELKILFPNKHDIYLHDTPSQGAFKKDMRAISHGCVRLENPRAMAAAVLSKPIDELNPYFKRSENTVRLENNIPIYLTYFTAWPNKTGEIQYYDDVYSRDHLMRLADDKIRDSRLNKD